MLFLVIVFLLLLGSQAEAAPIVRGGSCTGATTSCNLSSVSTGDLVLTFAFRSGSNAPPSAAANNTTIQTGATSGGQNQGSYRLSCRMASGPGDSTSGTYANATNVVSIAYAGTNVASTADCLTTGVGAKSGNNFAKGSTTVSYPTLSLTKTDTTSWVVGFMGGSASSVCSPTTLTSAATGGRVRVSDSNAAVASFAAATCTVTSETWMSVTLEIIQVPTVTQPPTPQPDRLKAGVFAGYQAWFRTSCDTEFSGWEHWAGGNNPAPGAVKFELWPDMREFAAGDVCATALGNLGNGSADTLYAAGHAGVINKHFEWMQSTGIDGIALQRFLSAATQNGAAVPNFRTWRDNTLQRIKTAAESTGRYFYVMYDVSGASGATLVSDIQTDFQHLESLSGNPLGSPNYVWQDGKRVISLYGCGFSGVGCTTTQAQQIIAWFKARDYYVIGGIPHWWHRSDVDPAQPSWESTYFQFDAIMPWAVGAYGDNTALDNYFKTAATDKSYTNANGVEYISTMFPGFAWSNWNGGAQNAVPRNAGNFLWRQAYRIKEMGGIGYIGMFDEFDEATAISKAAENSSMIPTDQYFLTLNADGTAMSSDFYLRLSGDATRMIKGQTALTLTIPTPFFVTPPSTPTNPNATAVSSTQINLTWTASTGTVSNYRVERCQGAGCSNFAEIAQPVVTSLNNTGLSASTLYRYQIRAWDGSSFSGYSTIVEATTQSVTVPSVPQNLVAAAASSSQINLSWSASTGTVVNYRVERCQDAGCSTFAEITQPTGTTYNNTGLSVSTIYRYRVRAWNGSVFSGYSTIAQTTTQSGAVGGLLTQNEVTYIGAFRVPKGSIGISTFEYCNPCVNAYNPTNNSLFVSGHDWHAAISEISIPTVVNSPTLGSLNTATVLQPFVEISEGAIYNIIPTSGAIQPGGLSVVGNNLFAAYYKYYDGAAEQVLSHFKSGKTLATTGDVTGPYQISGAPQAGFVDAWMADIPAAHQAALGGTHLLGNCCIPVIGRTSWGPAAFSVTLANLGTTIPLPSTPLLYYDGAHPTIGICESVGTIYDCTMGIKAAVFPNGTNTLLFFARKGTTDFCYGGGTTDPKLHRQPDPTEPGVILCYDPTDASKGGHGYPYIYKVLAYNVADLIAAKNGQRNPWDTTPYAVWDLSLPYSAPSGWLGGAAYDPATQRIFLMLRQIEQDVYPLVAVFQVGTPLAAPTAVTLSRRRMQ